MMIRKIENNQIPASGRNYRHITYLNIAQKSMRKHLNFVCPIPYRWKQRAEDNQKYNLSSYGKSDSFEPKYCSINQKTTKSLAWKEWGHSKHPI